MRVRILSGNAAGGELDLPQIEAEAAIATGYAEAVREDAPPPGTILSEEHHEPLPDSLEAIGLAKAAAATDTPGNPSE